LSKRTKSIVVVGAAADDLGVQCGGWTISWQGDSGAVTRGGTTILAGIRAAVDAGTAVRYSRDGADLNGATVAVVVIGEKPYAEMKGDRRDLRLSEADAKLVRAVKAAGLPVVTVLLSGRPLILDSTLDASDAFVAAWLPGTEGQGVADVLFGDVKPTGKLPRHWPRTNAQLGQTTESNALFPYGFGLSYAKEMSGL
jgi:beta-glucosidase